MIRRLFRPLAIVLLLAAAAAAQAGYLTNSNNTGQPKYGSFLASNIDSVNLANGGVSIRIPLVDRPSRGVDFDYSLGFESKHWVVTYYMYDDPILGPQTYYIWGLASNVSGWQPYQTGGGMLNYNEQVYTCSPYPNPEDAPAQIGVRSNWTYAAADGTQYSFPNRKSYDVYDSNRCIDDVANLNNELVGESDSSQYRLDITNDAMLAGGSISLLDRSGRQVSAGVGIEDTNGNVCCGGSGSWITDSSGRPVLNSAGGGIAYNDANGVPQSIAVVRALYSATPPFPTASCGTYCFFQTLPEPALGGVTSITLANGLAYTFSYIDPETGSPNPFGEIRQITLPNGGWIKYKWAVAPGFDPGPNDPTYGNIGLDAVVLVQRQMSADGVNVAEWDYAYTGAQTVVTGPAHTELVGGAPATVRDDEVHSFTACAGGFAPAMPLENAVEYFQGSHTSGTPLRKVETGWTCDTGPVYSSQLYGDLPDLYTETTTGPRNPRVASVTTTLEDVSPNLVKQTATTYGDTLSYTGADGNGYTDDLGNPDGVTEYDYGAGAPGAWLRTTGYTYLDGLAAYGPGGAHMLDRPTRKVVTGPAGQLALTNYSYDSTTVTSTGGGAAAHDDANYPASNTLRGNLTETSAWVSGSAYANSYIYYNDAGDAIQTVDPNGNATTTGYADSWANSACAPAAGSALAFPASVANALGQTIASAYNSCDGSLATRTDANSQTWSWSWDLMGRSTAANAPDGGVTTYAYNDVAGAYWVETKRKIDATRWTDAFDYFDGLGRPAGHSAANGEAIPNDWSVTGYDALGRTAFASYPCQGASASAAPGCAATGDSFLFDALGRPTLTTHGDGTSFITGYEGRATVTYDEGNGTSLTTRITRVAQNDALDNLASLCEVTGTTLLPLSATPNVPAACGQDIAATGFLTSYQHDALGNLLAVSQGSETRSFAYDGLSRLLSASNPESGLTSYAYDADSNVLTRTRPSPNQTGAYTVTTSYAWDALNRLLSKSYADADAANPATAAASYSYDQAAALGISSLGNTVGRLSSETAGNAGAVFSYDPMGRRVYDAQFSATHAGAYYSLGYLFDFAGDRIQESDNTAYQNGSMGTRALAYNQALRLTEYDSTLPQSPARMLYGVSYNAFGEPVSAQLGNGAAEARTYFSRGQADRINVTGPGGTLYNAYFGYAPNEDLVGEQDSVNGNWAYAFDDLNRLQSAACSADCPWGVPAGGTIEWGLDRYGNRWDQTDGLGNYTATGQPLTFAGGTTNQADAGEGVSYDAAGEVIGDNGTSYAWDAEGRLIGTNGAADYLYDAEGRRAAVDGQDYVLDPEGRWRVNVVWAPGPVASYGEEYAAGRHLATDAGGTTHFDHGDGLGTLRATSDSSGAPFEQSTSLPFGDALVENNSDWSPMHFTGQQRDPATGLDYFGARYYSSSLGRFLTPDPLGGHLEDPQTLNKYAYAGNNPVTRTDPTGLDFYLACPPGGATNSCQNGLQGVTTYAADADGNLVSSFAATVVSSDLNGNLTDQYGNSYAGTFNGTGVTFADDSGNASAGAWIQGSNPTSGITGGGALSSSFDFTFSDHGGGQALNASFVYNGDIVSAAAELEAAGFQETTADNYVDPEHAPPPGGSLLQFRTPGAPFTGAGSSHAIFEIAPGATVPAVGTIHTGEHNPYSGVPIGLILHCVLDRACE